MEKTVSPVLRISNVPLLVLAFKRSAACPIAWAKTVDPMAVVERAVNVLKIFSVMMTNASHFAVMAKWIRVNFVLTARRTYGVGRVRFAIEISVVRLTANKKPAETMVVVVVVVPADQASPVKRVIANLMRVVEMEGWMWAKIAQTALRM